MIISTTAQNSPWAGQRQAWGTGCPSELALLLQPCPGLTPIPPIPMQGIRLEGPFLLMWDGGLAQLRSCNADWKSRLQFRFSGCGYQWFLLPQDRHMCFTVLPYPGTALWIWISALEEFASYLIFFLFLALVVNIQLVEKNLWITT